MQGSYDRTAGKGQLFDAGTGQQGEDSRERTARKDSRDSKAKTGQRRQDGPKLTAWTGQLGQDNWHETIMTGQP
jgi:hypothetical protein